MVALTLITTLFNVRRVMPQTKVQAELSELKESELQLHAYRKTETLVYKIFRGVGKSKPFTHNVFALPKSDKPNEWIDYITDYLVKEWCEQIDYDYVRHIDFNGSRYLTDQGIKWLSEILPKCHYLRSISLDGCPNLTEKSLIYIFHSAPNHDIKISMQVCNIAFIPPEISDYFPSINYSTMEGNPLVSDAPYYEDKISPLPGAVLIWPQRGLKNSCLSILSKRKNAPLSHPSISLVKKWLVNDVEINALEVSNTETPIHQFLPNQINQVVIALDADGGIPKAEDHLIKSLFYLLNKEEPIPSVPKLQRQETTINTFHDDWNKAPPLPTDGELEDVARVQLKFASGKSRSVPTGQAFNGKYYNLTELRGWLVAIPSDKSIFWKGDERLTNHNSRFTVTVHQRDSENPIPVRIGICQSGFSLSGQSLGKSSSTFGYNPIEGTIFAFGKTYSKPVEVDRITRFPVQITLSLTQSRRDQYTITLQAHGKHVYADSVNAKEVGYPPVPAFHMNQDKQLSNVAVYIHSLAQGKMDKKLGSYPVKQPTSIPLGISFSIACSGKDSKKLSDHLSGMDFDKRMAESIEKQQAAIRRLQNKLPAISYKEQIDLGNLLRGQERIKLFLQERKQRMNIFKLDNVKNDEFIASLTSGVKRLSEVSPWSFIKVSAVLSNVAAILKKCQNLKKGQSILNLSDIAAMVPDGSKHMKNTMNWLHDHFECIYLPELDFAIFDVEWFYGFLYNVATQSPLKSEGRVSGLGQKCGVWDYREIEAFFKENSIIDSNINVVIEILENVGALTLLPCIRYKTLDEKFVFLNIFNNAEDIGEMTFYQEKKSSCDRLNVASRTYNQISADLYSLLPALLSLTCRVGDVQHIGPVGMVTHVGAVEVMIEADADSITISAYMRQLNLSQNTSGLWQMTVALTAYLWSVLHIFTDCLDYLLLVSGITTEVISSLPYDEPPNYCLSYQHNWKLAGVANDSRNSVCTLCHRCTDKGLDCPFNGIMGPPRHLCLCGSEIYGCVDCGICRTCIRTLWKFHSKVFPNRVVSKCNKVFSVGEVERLDLIFPGPLGVIQPELNLKMDLTLIDTGGIRVYLTDIETNSALQVYPFEVIEDKNEDGQQQGKDGDNAAAKKDSDEAKAEAALICHKNVQIEIKDVDSAIRGLGVHQKKQSRNFNYSMKYYVDIFQDAGILSYTYHGIHSRAPIGLFVGMYPAHPSKCQFTVEMLDTISDGSISIGFATAKATVGRNPAMNNCGVGYRGSGGIHSGSTVTKASAPGYTNKDVMDKGLRYITVKIIFDSPQHISGFQFYLGSDPDIANSELVCDLKISTTEKYFPYVSIHRRRRVRLVDRTLWTVEDPDLEAGDEDIFHQPFASFGPKSGISLVDFRSPKLAQRMLNNSQRGIFHVILHENAAELLLTTEMKVSHDIVSDNTGIDIVKVSKDTFTCAIPYPGLFTFALCVSYPNRQMKGVEGSTVKVSIPSEACEYTFPVVFNTDPYKVSEGGNANLYTDADLIDGKLPEHCYQVNIKENFGPSTSFYVSAKKFNLGFTDSDSSQNSMNISLPCFAGPVHTANFIVGSGYVLRNNVQMIRSIDYEARTFISNGISSEKSFDAPDLKSLLCIPGNRDLLISYPNIGLFPEEDSRVSYVHRALHCKEILKSTIVGCEQLRVQAFDKNLLKSTNKTVHFIFTPNFTANSDLLCRHSVLDITESESMILHLLCSPVYTDTVDEIYESPHFLTANGFTIENTNDKIVFLSKDNNNMYLTLTAEKFLLPKNAKLVPSMNVSKEEMECRINKLLIKVGAFLFIQVLFAGNSAQSNLIAKNVLDEKVNEVGLEEGSHGFVCNTHLKTEVDFDTMTDEKPSPENIMKYVEHELEYSTFVHRLRLSGNNVTELPEQYFEAFPQVRSLVIVNMKALTKLPNSIGKLKMLTSCQLSNLSIKSLPTSFSNLSHPKSLDLQKIPLEALPSNCPQNSRLNAIRVNILPLKSFQWSSLRRLKVLELNNVALNDLPPEFSLLQTLEVLTIQGIPWFEDILEKLGNDGDDSLFQQKIQEAIDGKDLSAENIFARCTASSTHNNIINSARKKEYDKICAQICLETPRFGLGYTEKSSQFGGFPPCIFKLKKLRRLTLMYHAVRHLPKEIVKLNSLEFLELSNNPLLISLPEQLSKLKKLKKIGIRRCPALKTPPPEVVSRGHTAIISFLKFLSSDQVPCRRTKLMFVGLGGAGKTSLLKSLMANKPSNNLTAHKDITDGIDIGKWDVTAPGGLELQFSTWDFAGQSVYYNTHQFFLSKRAVYLLLWTVRLGYEHAGLDFWLSSIMCHAPDAPVFVIGTHCDQVAKYVLPQADLKMRYPQIAGFHFVSCLSGEGIENLRSSIIARTLAQKYMEDRIPRVVLDFEMLIKFKRQEHSIIPWSEMKTLAMKSGFCEEKDIKQAVQLLHDLGSIQYFDTQFLRDMVVIKPQWIADVMACIVSVKESPIVDGIMLHKDMQVIWTKFDENLHPWLLRLTEEFDLTFPLIGSNVTDPANIVPCLLPEEEPNMEWPVLSEELGEKETHMTYDFSYLPAGLFNRIQVRLFELSNGKTIWKHGSLLHKNGHRAIVKQENDFRLSLRVRGTRPENVAFLIHEVIDGLVKESFQGVTYDQSIPCPDCFQDGTVSDYAIFQISLIRLGNRKKAPFLQCHKNFHFINLSTLSALVPPSSDADFDDQLKKSLVNLSDMTTALASGVAITYLPSDFNDKALVKPSEIRKLVQTSHPTCTDLSSLSAQDLYISLRDFALLVVLLSRNYAEDTDMKGFLRYAMEIQKKPVLIVCIGENKGWQDTEMGMLIGQEVYVDMTQRKKDVIDEQKKTFSHLLEVKLSGTSNQADFPHVFISYSWANSHSAAQGSQKGKNSSLGWKGGDPRQLCQIIKKAGIGCWIDVERTGSRGLFEDISLGLRQASVIVACLSNEYKKSENCMAELQHGVLTLKKPVIYIIVGTSNEWRWDELGFLMRKKHGVEIDMQTESKTAHDDLIKEIKKSISKREEEESTSSQSKSSKTTKGQDKISKSLKQSFQEEYELAQRKFMKQVTYFSNAASSQHYPRLVVLDLLASGEGTNDGKPTGDESWNKRQICFKVLCENQRGWHVCGSSIPHKGDQSARLMLVGSAAPYLVRVYSLLLISGVHLNCLGGDTGYFDYVRSQEKASSISAKDAYANIITAVIECDEDTNMGGLDRCHLSSGKVLWLCKEHQTADNGRVTVIPADNSGNRESEMPSTFDGDLKFVDRLVQMNSQELKLHQKKFAESCNKFLTYEAKNSKKGDEPSTQYKGSLKRRPTSFMVMQGDVNTPNQNDLPPLRPKTGKVRRTDNSKSVQSKDSPRQNRSSDQKNASNSNSAKNGPTIPSTSPSAASVQSKACDIL